MIVIFAMEIKYQLPKMCNNVPPLSSSENTRRKPDRKCLRKSELKETRRRRRKEKKEPYLVFRLLVVATRKQLLKTNCSERHDTVSSKPGFFRKRPMMLYIKRPMMLYIKRPMMLYIKIPIMLYIAVGQFCDRTIKRGNN